MLRKTAHFLVAIVAVCAGVFLVVLLLHVAAVGGIYAFTGIRSSQPAREMTSSLPPAAAESRVRTDIPAPTVVAHTYTVKKDDRLLNIARRFNVSSDDLVAVNDIRDPDRLRIGQALKIPAKKTN